MGRRLPHFLDDGEPERLLRATTRQADRLMLMSMRYLGLRVSEVCSLRAEHIDFGKRLLMVREGKGKKDRALPLPKLLLGPLRGWLGKRTEGWVFPGRGGGKRSVRSLQLLVKRMAAKAGLRAAGEPRRVTPHKLRHHFCTEKIARGIDLAVVRDLMGHSSIAVTDVYSHATASRLREAMELDE